MTGKNGKNGDGLELDDHLRLTLGLSPVSDVDIAAKNLLAHSEHGMLKRGNAPCS